MTHIDALLDALGIEAKRKRGKRIWALCPYHDDHSPTNWFIRLAGDRYGQHHCFSCKKGGTLTELVMHVRSCDYDAARAFINLLGKGYEPPKARVRIVARVPVIGRIRFKMPFGAIFEPLKQWVTPARQYAKERGITHDEVETFGLGYAVEGRLSGRIILPWRMQGGHIAGYSARTFCDQDPRYQTPDRKENADRAVMFGEHLWPEPSRRGIVIVTEGALNALAVRRTFKPLSLIDAYVAAMGGSEIEPLHVTKLATFQMIVILTDSDRAGDDAAKALKSQLGRHKIARRVRLPDDKDALDVGQKFLRRAVEDALLQPM